MPLNRTSVRLAVCAIFLALSATAAPAQQRTDFGTLSVQVRPAGAEVFIDGERWVGADASGPLQVQLAPGSHLVEVRAPGRRPYTTEVSIRSGETTPLNVALPEGPAPTRQPAPPAAPPSTPSSGRIVRVSPSEDGYVFAPDFKITDINHETGALVGVHGGRRFGGQVLIGAGGYWQANTSYGARLAYGGPVVEWRVRPKDTIGFNLHALVGGGTWYADQPVYYHDVRVDVGGPMGGAHVSMAYPYRYSYYDVFFVVEPEAQIVVRFGSSARLQGGVGYRATSANGLSGVSGSIGLQFGR